MIGTIYGRLTKDPEITRGTKDGKEWVKAAWVLACNNCYPSDETSFYNCEIFGKRAEVVAKYFKKGSEMVTTGEFRQDPYTDKEGNKKRPWTMHSYEFNFCGRRTESNNELTPEGFENIAESIPF